MGIIQKIKGLFTKKAAAEEMGKDFSINWEPVTYDPKNTAVFVDNEKIMEIKALDAQMPGFEKWFNKKTSYKPLVPEKFNNKLTIRKQKSQRKNWQKWRGR